jgi:hypothetical protein
MKEERIIIRSGLAAFLGLYLLPWKEIQRKMWKVNQERNMEYPWIVLLLYMGFIYD